RMTRKGADNIYAVDAFQTSQDGDLSLVSGSEYGARVEHGDFHRYFYANNAWTMQTKDGLTYTFGTATSSRIIDPTNSSHIFAWYVTEIRDANGNYITFTYTKDQNQIYPSHITYTNGTGVAGIYDVGFNIDTRSDEMVSFASAFAVTTTDRITSIEIKSQNTLRRKYELAYTTGDNGRNSMLRSIKETG